MVTSLAAPQQAKRPAVQQQAATFQSSLENTQQSANMDYQNGPQNTSLAKPYASNPFLSPNTSETWSTDEESGHSSGQDEFHLERYSQDAARQADQSKKRRGLGSRSRRARRPDLNIVTEMPGSQARACGPGIIVEQVKAKKAATTRPKSVLSSKAEHIHDPFPVHRNNALAGLKETARLRHEKNKLQREVNKSNHDHKLPADRVMIANTSRVIDRSDQKPVVIGISMPKEEAEAQRHVGDESAIALRTPSIIVTPAAAEAPWSSSTQLSNRRPISSSYSMALEPTREQHHGGYVPPLPQTPASFNNLSRPQAKSQDQSDDKHSVSSWERDDSLDDLDEQDVEQPHLEKSRFSSESQERILPSATDPDRPKSQGWWNLALSPMLSRTGTNKSATTRTPGEGDVPPLPSAIDRRRSRSAAPDLQISPETPRRLGLASARASTWSRWTTWEKQKDGPTPVSEQEIQKTIQRASRHPVHHSGLNVTALLPPAKPTEGLAAEYYRACAIEQLTGESYFECENHSCAEKLPALHSVFDRDVAAQGSRHAAAVDHDVGEGIIADPEHHRSISGATNAISPDDLSPNVRQADTVSLMKARVIGSETAAVKHQTMPTPEPPNSVPPGEKVDRAASPAPIPMPSPPKQAARYPNIAAIVPPQHSVHRGAPIASPGPISPEMQTSMTSQGALPMSDMRTETRPQNQAGMPQSSFYNYDNYAPDGPRRNSPGNAYIYNTEHKPSPQISQRPVGEDASRRESKEEAKEKKLGLFSRLRSCVKNRKIDPTASASTPKKRRRVTLIFILLLLMIIACVALATQLTRRGDRTPTQQQWLNLTGYPPMPTGISTIIRPDLVRQQDQCVSPNTLWSCSLPKENQAEVAPNNPDQPNFRFEIKFRNGTVPGNMTIPVDSSDKNLKRKRANDPFTNELFTPNPPPPSRAEQIFMGNTTDNITEPFDGEETPFFMTFIPAFPIDPNDPSINTSTTADLNTRSFSSDAYARLDARQDQNISSAIPAPSTQADGSAAPADLLPTDPYPFAQPIRLYNRGLQDEHYGFYMYYDKSIFSASTTPLEGTNTNTNTSTSKRQTSTNDIDGGSLLASAKARCTFAQTRFLIRIYTNPSFPATLLFSDQRQFNTTTNSATNYTPPGSFPYPASITLDRHGGNINKKLIYCYGVNNLQVIDANVKSVVAERRGISGQLVNAAPGLVRFEGEVDEGFDEGAGGIDGGSGGCGCSWQNWN